MTQLIRRVAVSLFTFSVLTAVATAADWGTLRGRFVVEGTAPAPKPISVNKDPEVCGKHKLVEETVVVGPSGGLANAFVYLRTKKPAVHPDYAKTANDKVSIDNHGCRFEPHAQVLRTSQTLVIKNSDQVGHNTKADCFANPAFNVIIPSGGDSNQKLTLEESMPIKVGCNIHPWMGGYLLVRKDPYATVSDKDGSFEIKNLPAGKDLEFQMWHEGAGYFKAAKIAGMKVDSKGRFKLKLTPGESKDLGDIKVSASAFNK